MQDILSLLDTADYLLELRAPQMNVDNWKSTFIHCVQEWGFTMKNQHIYSSHELMAHYEFFAPQEINFSIAPTPLVCPWVNEIQGYMALTLELDSSLNSVEEFFLACIKEGQGQFIGLHRNSVDHAVSTSSSYSPTEGTSLLCIPCVALLEQPITLGKFAFEDGALLLSDTSEEYLSDIINTIKGVFVPFEIDVHIYIASTHHNPLRYNLFSPLSSHSCLSTPINVLEEEMPDVLSQLIHGLSIEMWGFNFEDDVIQTLLQNTHIGFMF